MPSLLPPADERPRLAGHPAGNAAEVKSPHHIFCLKNIAGLSRLIPEANQIRPSLRPSCR